jgi:hypothetical protein
MMQGGGRGMMPGMMGGPGQMPPGMSPSMMLTPSSDRPLEARKEACYKLDGSL